jgi:hypothetical protein
MDQDVRRNHRPMHHAGAVDPAELLQQALEDPDGDRARDAAGVLPANLF